MSSKTPDSPEVEQPNVAQQPFVDFHGRQWVFQKLIKEPGMVVNSFNCSLLLGALGSGKSTILNHLASNAHLCGGVLLGQFRCSPQTNAFDFVFSIASQLQKRIPYLQVPSRQQLADLYVHNAWKGNGFVGVGRSFQGSELTHAGTGRGSQWSNLSIEEQSELYSIDMNTMTTSDPFNYSFAGLSGGGGHAFWSGQASSQNLMPGTTTTGATGGGGGAGSSVYGALDSGQLAAAYGSKLLPKQFSTASSFDCYSDMDSGGIGLSGGVGGGTGSSMMLPSLSGAHQRAEAREDIFWRYVLEPIIDHGLNRWEDRCFLLLIDSIDIKREICELISRHLLVLPNFLHVIVSARPGRRKGFSRMFNGCRKVIIDDTRKDTVLEDMRMYVHHEVRRRKMDLNQEHLHRVCVCSDGCYLYPQLYLSALDANVLPADLMPPATLNGLYFILFSLLFDQLPLPSQTLVRRLFSLLLSAEPLHQLGDQQAQRLLVEPEFVQPSSMPAVEKRIQFGRRAKEAKPPKRLSWAELMALLQKYQLISLEDVQSSLPIGDLDWSQWADGLEASLSPGTPETPKAAISYRLIKPSLPSLLSWVRDVKHCGRRFHCSSELGHLLQVLHNPPQQSAWALAQHVQACGLAGMPPNVQAMLYLIHCHPTQLPGKLHPSLVDSNASTTQSTPEAPMINATIGVRSPKTLPNHPLISFIQNCVQTPLCRSPAYEESTQDGTEAELISDVLGELHSGCDLQLQISSIDNTSEPTSDHPDTHSPHQPMVSSPDLLAADRTTPTMMGSFLAAPATVGTQTPLTSGGVPSPTGRWTPSPNTTNRPQLAPKLVFDPCKPDPSTLTFDMEQLLSAITDEDESLLRLLLENCGQLLHAYDERGLTPLLHAIDCGCSGRLLDLLSQFELDVNQPSEQLRCSPLMLAAARNQLELAERLLEMDADVNAKDVYNDSALILAVRAGASVAMVQLLLYWGGEATELDDQGRSLITLAVIASADSGQSKLVDRKPQTVDDEPQDRLLKADKNSPPPPPPVGSGNCVSKRKPTPATCSVIHPNLIRFIPTFSQSRFRSSSASAAQASWVRNSQLLEADNSLVLPNSSYEHRLFRVQRSSTNAAPNTPKAIAIAVESDAEQRDLNALQVIRALVDAGARAEQADQSGCTSLHWAATAGAAPLLLDYFIQLGGKRLLETVDHRGWLPIHCAAAAGRVQLLKPLSSGGLLHRLTLSDGLTVLACAVRSFQFDAVISLVRRCGARLDQLDKRRCSVLYWVAMVCGRRLVRLRKQRKRRESMIDRPGKEDEEEKEEEEKNRLLSVDQTSDQSKDSSHDQLFQVDIGHWSDDDSDVELDSPVSRQATLKKGDEGQEEEEKENSNDDEEDEGEEDDECNDDEEAENDNDEEGRTDEEHRKKIRMLKLLIALGADLECRDGNGRTALHVAAYLDDRRATQLLLSGGSKVDSVDAQGRTPLHMCAYSGAYGTARLLLGRQGSARPDWRSTDGSCALAVALRLHRKRICALLLRAGADPKIKDSKGQTAFDLVKQMDPIEGQKFRAIFSLFGHSVP